jgi:hypothetical protein
LPSPRGALSLAGVAVLILLAGISAPGVRAGDAPARWVKHVRIDGAVDLAGPRPDGSFVLTAGGRLFTLAADGTGPTPFARGRGGYRSSAGEPYISVGGPPGGAGEDCALADGSIFAIEPRDDPGLVRISPSGRASRFAEFPDGVFLSGIAFDRVGTFGGRLLVMVLRDRKTSSDLYAFDCDGGRERIVTGGPRVEGGIEVAPASFGPFAGDLIAPNERSGKVHAFGPDGEVATIAKPTLPAGGDTGVESIGFVPPGLAPGAQALLSDLGVKKGVGTDSVLALDLAGVPGGVAPGDLLVATELGAETVRLRCELACSAETVASGPARTHAEGHIVFTAP